MLINTTTNIIPKMAIIMNKLSSPPFAMKLPYDSDVALKWCPMYTHVTAMDPPRNIKIDANHVKDVMLKIREDIGEASPHSNMLTACRL